MDGSLLAEFLLENQLLCLCEQECNYGRKNENSTCGYAVSLIQSICLSLRISLKRKISGFTHMRSTFCGLMRNMGCLLRYQHFMRRCSLFVCKRTILRHNHGYASLFSNLCASCTMLSTILKYASFL